MSNDKSLSPKSLELVARRFAVLSEPARLRILQELRAAPRTVGELVTSLELQQANVSKHLQVLYRAGVVARRRAGLHVYYRILDPSIFELCDLVCGSLESQLEAELQAVRERESR